MKKDYIKPDISQTLIDTELVIMASPVTTHNQLGDDEEYVKRQTGTQSKGDLWDSEW